MVPAASSVTVAGTFAAAPAARRVKVAVVIVAAFMGLLNVALTVVLSGTLTAPFGGAWAVTVGRTSVVKLQTTFAPIAVPITSVTVPDTVAVEAVLIARGEGGGRGGRGPVALSGTVAGTFAAAPAPREGNVAVGMG